ncbi:hypothetical protein AB8O64_15850 [Streptomyces sp. QH1-20]|uniref:hypothetical protein n=1 Tax=Streptomyces sp. QH1-20 TaxID=3240934 RepID=UPI0035179174
MAKVQVDPEALRASFLAAAQEVLDGYVDLIDAVEAEETRIDRCVDCRSAARLEQLSR